jgi:hypothetical protein
VDRGSGGQLAGKRDTIGAQASLVGLNTSHKDASFQAVVDMVELAKITLAGASTYMVTILTIDHQIILWLLITDKHNNVAVYRSICESLAFTLFNHPNMIVTISWILGLTGFLPLKHVLEVASNAAAIVDPTEQHPPLSSWLWHEAKLKALADWEKV